MSRRPVGSPSLRSGLESCLRRAMGRRVRRTGPGLHAHSHYDFEHGLFGFALLQLSLSRLLTPALVVGRLTLRVGLDVEAIEAQTMFGERAAQRVLLRLEPLSHRRHLGLDVRLQSTVLDSQ